MGGTWRALLGAPHTAPDDSAAKGGSRVTSTRLPKSRAAASAALPRRPGCVAPSPGAPHVGEGVGKQSGGRRPDASPTDQRHGPTIQRRRSPNVVSGLQLTPPPVPFTCLQHHTLRLLRVAKRLLSVGPSCTAKPNSTACPAVVRQWMRGRASVAS